MLTLKQVIQATPAQIKLRAQNQCYGQLSVKNVKNKPEEEPVAEEAEEEQPVGEDGTATAKPKKVRPKKPAALPPGMLEDENGKYREFTYRVKCTDGWRNTILRVYGSVSPSGRCWVWCDCPYFKYHCEVALAHRGSSSVINSNGQRPRFTNPNLEPRTCKHSYLSMILAIGKKKHS